MAKREFLQLAHVLNLEKHRINGAYVSDKYDGQRAFWDGGISRGLLASEVPWANVEKDGRLIRRPVATGLWSRYGKVIYAPDYFLDSLPPFMLDGELFMGPGTFQDLMTVAGSHVPGLGWKNVKFMVLDSPRPRLVFEDGIINHVNYRKTFKGILPWINDRGFKNPVSEGAYYDFHSMLSWLDRNLPQNEHTVLAPQERLPMGTDAAHARLDERLGEVLAAGGEGVIVRRANSLWLPERSHDCLKYKPENDAEGIVIGYVWGRRTALGSKLLGKMGAMVLNFRGKRLELSGFTNEERELSVDDEGDELEGIEFPGKEVGDHWTNPKFPRGSVVSFKYRELTKDGLPKEARFWRKRAQASSLVR